MASNAQVEYTLLDEVDALKCLICLDLASDPQQHEKCGKLFCRKCLEKLGRDKPCPNCRQSSSYFDDIKSKCKESYRVHNYDVATPFTDQLIKQILWVLWP